MKLALAISGLAREYPRGYLDIKRCILDRFDTDVFIFSSAKASSEDYRTEGSFRYKDAGQIEDYINLFKPAMYQILRFTDEIDKHYIDLENKYGVHRSDNYVRRYIAMLDGIYNANKLVTRYSKQFGVTYDYVIRARPDMKLDMFELPTKPIAIDRYGNGRNNLGDVFACGEPYIMSYYASLRNCLDYYVTQEGQELNTEVLLDHHFSKRLAEVETTTFVSDIYRP